MVLKMHTFGKSLVLACKNVVSQQGSFHRKQMKEVLTLSPPLAPYGAGSNSCGKKNQPFKLSMVSAT